MALVSLGGGEESSERNGAVPVVQLEPNSQSPSPALSTLAAAVSWQHLWWAFIKVDAFSEGNAAEATQPYSSI